MLANARSSSAGSTSTGGSVSGTATATWAGSCSSDAEGRRRRRPRGRRAGWRPHRAGVEAAHVEEVADEAVQPVGFGVDGLGELAALLDVPRHVGLEEARGRRLDRRQRRAEVVADGLEQRGAELVGLGQPGRHGRLGLEPAGLQGQGRGCDRKRAQHPLVVGRQVGAPQDEHGAAVAGEVPSLAVERLGGRVGPGAGVDDPSVVAVGQQRDGVEGERGAELVEQAGQRVRLADEDAAGPGQRARLGPGLQRLAAAAGDPVDEDAGPDGGGDEDQRAR